MGRPFFCAGSRRRPGTHAIRGCWRRPYFLIRCIEPTGKEGFDARGCSRTTPPWLSFCRMVTIRTGTEACPYIPSTCKALCGVFQKPEGRAQSTREEFHSPPLRGLLKKSLDAGKPPSFRRKPESILRLLPFVGVLAPRRGMKRRHSFIRIRKWIPAFAGMTNENQIRRGPREVGSDRRGRNRRLPQGQVATCPYQGIAVEFTFPGARFQGDGLIIPASLSFPYHTNTDSPHRRISP